MQVTQPATTRSMTGHGRLSTQHGRSGETLCDTGTVGHRLAKVPSRYPFAETLDTRHSAGQCRQRPPPRLQRTEENRGTGL